MSRGKIKKQVGKNDECGWVLGDRILPSLQKNQQRSLQPHCRDPGCSSPHRVDPVATPGTMITWQIGRRRGEWSTAEGAQCCMSMMGKLPARWGSLAGARLQQTGVKVAAELGYRRAATSLRGRPGMARLRQRGGVARGRCRRGIPASAWEQFQPAAKFENSKYNHH